MSHWNVMLVEVPMLHGWHSAGSLNHKRCDSDDIAFLFDMLTTIQLWTNMMSHDALRRHIALWLRYKAARLVDAGATVTRGRGFLARCESLNDMKAFIDREAWRKCTDLYECSIYLWPRAIIFFFCLIVFFAYSFFISCDDVLRWTVPCVAHCLVFLYHSIMDKYRLPYILYWIWFPMVFYRKYILYIYEIYETAPLLSNSLLWETAMCGSACWLFSTYKPVTWFVWCLYKSKWKNKLLKNTP